MGGTLPLRTYFPRGGGSPPSSPISPRPQLTPTKVGVIFSNRNDQREFKASTIEIRARVFKLIIRFQNNNHRQCWKSNFVYSRRNVFEVCYERITYLSCVTHSGRVVPRETGGNKRFLRTSYVIISPERTENGVIKWTVFRENLIIKFFRSRAVFTPAQTTEIFTPSGSRVRRPPDPPLNAVRQRTASRRTKYHAKR